MHPQTEQQSIFRTILLGGGILRMGVVLACVLKKSRQLARENPRYAYGGPKCVGTEFLDNQSINQYIYNAPWYRGACYSADYAETKRNVLSRVLNVLTDGADRQFRGSDKNV